MKALLLSSFDAFPTLTVQKFFRLIDISGKPYNLRSKNKQMLKCYLQEGRIPPHFNPVVVLKERVPYIDTNTHRFQVAKDNKILIKETVNNNWKGFNFFTYITCFCLILSLPSLYYFQVYVQDYFKPIINKNTCIAKETSDTSEIRDLVLSALYKPKEEGNEEERPMSFIQEQCLISEGSTKLDDSVTNVNDIFHNENLTDYALETKGARIVSIFDTKHYGFVSLKLWDFEFGSGLSYFYEKYFYSKLPHRILIPWRKPGDCWAFKGSYGRVKIELWDRIRISAITIDHVRNENLSLQDISSAPKTFLVAAVEDENSDGIFLGAFEYKITGPSVQTFPISSVLVRNLCRFVEITITSNHGNQDYTCLYRVRVHGRK